MTKIDEIADGNRLTNADLSCLLTSTFSIVSITVNVFVCTATIFGNILILISIYKYSKQFKGSLYMFIGNLAVADLLLGLWLLLLLYEEVVPDVKQDWYFCVTKPIGVLISYSCSILTLIGISFDRFMAVIFPLKHLVHTYKRKFFIAYLTLIWIISIIGGSLTVILPNLEPPSNTFVCRIGAILPPGFELVSSVALLLAILINSSLFGVVMWKIKTKEIPGNSNSQKKNTKTVLMIVIFVTFAVCWLPFVICSFLLQANIAPSTFQNVVCAQEYLARLGFVNSAQNWIIYGLANRNFRTAFKKILCCNGCTFPLKPVSFSTDGSRSKSACKETECPVNLKQNETVI
ncbi:melatonin receptor type 1A-like [Mercenaria mercenaria]|uniref:melatonin receptor type 1A-like n=1 Tax=Mercenaria mercenaria TaxID=6596 RepID=UPI00234ECCC3|nr:melatonin receptor type 1A-like [Mercenaria mercenaria]